jgi:hypothetical protein
MISRGPQTGAESRRRRINVESVGSRYRGPFARDLTRPQMTQRRTSNDGVVAGTRYELYSAYPIRVPAVPASVIATG